MQCRVIAIINNKIILLRRILCGKLRLTLFSECHSRRRRNGSTKGTEILDAIDRRLLAELQAEGRVTNVELAQRVGLTAPPCLRRVRALEDAGVIRGYHADLDASKLGFSITVFALVSLKSQAEESLRQFEDHMRTLAEVRECHMLNGEIDFILKIVSKDLQSFQEFLTSKLTPAPNVASVKTSLTIRTAKQVPGVPLEE